MYWQNSGGEKTEATLEIALDRLDGSEIRNVVIASKSGETVNKFLELADDTKPNVVCVTHHVGFKEPGVDEMKAEKREELKDKGVEVLTTTHVLAGVARSIKNDYGGLYPAEIMAEALRTLSQGVKVAVEISIMAVDAGLVPYGEELIAVGGTGWGADTACVIRPGHSNEVFETDVLEVLCRPRES
ncbi:hypothetical protein KGY79_06775 [Candidatus Bipolaricaulota bacterium]|nr:hypothetical protein [Candidatus Bipolaricaulota bacterium]